MKKKLGIFTAILIIALSVAGLMACVDKSASYTVTFVADGVTIGTATYTAEDKEITEPDVTPKAGYRGKWEEYTLTTGDITVNAVYTAIEYTVTFVADGKTVGTATYTAEDKEITEPDVPTKADYFGEWEDYTLTTGDITVEAVYTPIVTEGLQYSDAVDGKCTVTGYEGSDKEIYIPKSHEGAEVIAIGGSAFWGCSNLTSITIPDSVTTIGSETFGYCSNLTRITYQGSQAQWEAISKGNNWNYKTGNYTIACSNGEIGK